MKAIYLILLMIIGVCGLQAQKIKIKEFAQLPEPITNNAISEGTIDDIRYLYSFGGLDSTKLYSGIHQRSYRFNIQNKTWDQIPSIPDSLGKIAMAANRIKDIIYIIGGYHVFEDHHEVSSNKVHRFDIRNNKFLSDGATAPIPIDDHVQAVWNDSLIYTITGWSNKGNIPNVQFYDPSINKWTVATPVPNKDEFMVFGASGIIVGNTIYYYGGAKYAKHYPGQNILRIGKIDPSNPAKIEWQAPLQTENKIMYRSVSIASKEKIFWLGGSNITYNYNGIAYNGTGGVPISESNLVYNIKKNSWYKPKKNALPMDLRGVAFFNDKSAFIIGGMGKNQKVSNLVYKIEF